MTNNNNSILKTIPSDFVGAGLSRPVFLYDNSPWARQPRPYKIVLENMFFKEPSAGAFSP
jgi:hypothetical protein